MKNTFPPADPVSLAALTVVVLFAVPFLFLFFFLRTLHAMESCPSRNAISAIFRERRFSVAPLFFSPFSAEQRDAATPGAVFTNGPAHAPRTP